jgi:hypothetical protein
MAEHLPLTEGTRVIALRNLGPIRAGAPGVITGVTEMQSFWRRKSMYLCEFATVSGSAKVAARPQEVDTYNHVRTVE